MRISKKLNEKSKGSEKKKDNVKPKENENKEVNETTKKESRRNRDKKNKKGRGSKILFYVGLMLVVGGSSFLIWNLKKQNERKNRTLEYAKYLNSDSKDKIHEKINDNMSENEKRIRETYKNAIGIVEIKKLGVFLPIFNETGKIALDEGSGLLEKTDYPSDKKGTTSVIAAHRGGTSGKATFLHVDKLVKGDEVIVHLKGKKLKYKVVGSKVIDPYDWSHFGKQKDKSKLILLTCHPFPTIKQRLLVFCELVEK